MENHCLYKIQHFHVLVTLESEQLKVTALNLLEASRLSGRFPAGRPTSPAAYPALAGRGAFRSGIAELVLGNVNP
jgi:hypothetical protein